MNSGSLRMQRTHRHTLTPVRVASLFGFFNVFRLTAVAYASKNDVAPEYIMPVSTSVTGVALLILSLRTRFSSG